MRILLVTIYVILAATSAFGQASAGPGKDAGVKEGLRELSRAYNETGSKKDRAALERLFADEYVWYQANGNVVDKTKLINGIMGNEAQFSVPVGSYDGVLVFGDVAVNRGAFEGA